MPGAALDTGETVNELTKILCLPTTHSPLKIITYFYLLTGETAPPTSGKTGVGVGAKYRHTEGTDAPESGALPAAAVHSRIGNENLTCLGRRVHLHVAVTPAGLNTHLGAVPVLSLPALWSCTRQL